MKIAPLHLVLTLAGLISWTTLATWTSAQPRPCVRSSDRPASSSSTIVLRKTSGFPCKILVVDRGIVLKADAAGEVDVIREVTRAPSGRFYSSTISGQISTWGVDGKFLNNFGRTGNGPGEFARGNKRLLLDEQGRLLVADNNMRWSVFDANDKFISTFPVSTMGTGIGGCCVILDDGSFLTGWINPAEAFRIYDIRQRKSPTPLLVRAFGPKEKIRYSSRRIAYAGGKTFWAAPPGGSADRYVLEEWNTDGTLVRTLRRDVPWVPSEVDKTENAALEPDITALNLDARGLLYVHICIKTAGFATLSAKERGSLTALDRAYNCYHEVIDTKNNTVLASTGPLKPTVANKEFPLAYFPRSNEGVQYFEDEVGLPRARIVQVTLVSNDG